MSVDKDTVAKIANLSRLAIREEDLEPMTGELNNILQFVEQLAEVNTDGVEPMLARKIRKKPQKFRNVHNG